MSSAQAPDRPLEHSAILECRQVTVHYGRELPVTAVRSLDLRIDRGEFLAICGSSGSGKSTLLTVLGLLRPPTAGNLLFRGMQVEALPERDLAALRARSFGFVFQSFHLLRGRSALENVELGMLYTHTPTQRRELAREALRVVGLEHRSTHGPNELSGGEQQRVAVARAIASRPTVILADEPTGNLDSATAEQILDLFASVHATGVTMVVVTHSPDVASRCQRLITMSDGSIANRETMACAR